LGGDAKGSVFGGKGRGKGVEGGDDSIIGGRF